MKVLFTLTVFYELVPLLGTKLKQKLAKLKSILFDIPAVNFLCGD